MSPAIPCVCVLPMAPVRRIPSARPLSVRASLVGEVVHRGEPMAVLDVREDAQYQFMDMARQEGLCSLLSVPLRMHTRVIGVLNVYTAERRHFQPTEVAVLSALAAQSATAIE